MAKLTFNVEEVRGLVAHSKGREHSDNLYGMPLDIKEYLYLVHDEGVYLMSGAKESNLSPETIAYNELVKYVGWGRESTSQIVAYAKGCNPKEDVDYYEEARALVGGDDFGEPISLDFWEAALKAHDAVGAKTLTLNFGATKISIAAPRRGR